MPATSFPHSNCTRDIAFRCLSGLAFALLVGWNTPAQADPCGMVPPITATHADAITRTGAQKTYVFYKNGVESFVIRPGFKGKVDNFGMLIPFPTPPAIRKIPDELFSHITAAIDPPEIPVRLYPIRRTRSRRSFRGIAKTARSAAPARQEAKQDVVRVLRQEAVGMYQVAVLEAGSAKALKRWMDANKYRYPKGMDKPVNDYVKAGWCFVAVKTRVSSAKQITPRPGMRRTKTGIPAGGSFDGHVQGMGFRFKTKELVVPMRLSAFNKGRMRNIVYLLTESPKQIRHIPSKLVVRQVSGQALYDNVTLPLPMRIIDLRGTETRGYIMKRLKAQYGHSSWMRNQRNQEKVNLFAKNLFASDLASARTGKLILALEELEKTFVNIGEMLMLRGPQLDKLHLQTLRNQTLHMVATSLTDLKSMVMTVVDGDFPRKVLARDNLHFSNYTMRTKHNTPRYYNTRTARPDYSWKPKGLLKGPLQKLKKAAMLPPKTATQGIPSPIQPKTGVPSPPTKQDVTISGITDRTITQLALNIIKQWWWGFGILLLLLVVFIASHKRIKARSRTINGLFWLAGSLLALGAFSHDAQAQTPPNTNTIKQWVKQLGNKATAQQAITSLKQAGEPAVPFLIGSAIEGPALPPRGWAIACLSHIGGPKAIQALQRIYKNRSQPALVRTWAAAGFINQLKNIKQLDRTLSGMRDIKALQRPVLKRIEALVLNGTQTKQSKLTHLLSLTRQYKYQKLLTPVILKQPVSDLVQVMLTGKDNFLRRRAAGYIASFRSRSSQKTIARTLVKQLRFRSSATQPPWRGGALFIPSLYWRAQRKYAKQMVDQLMRWMLFCSAKRDAGCQRQIHNNIRSFRLAYAVGYRPTWSQRGAGAWLRVWKRIKGREHIRRMFKQQGLPNSPHTHNMYKQATR